MSQRSRPAGRGRGWPSPAHTPLTPHSRLTSAPRALTITLPDPPGDPADGPLDLTGWLHSLAGSTLPGLLRQGDPQHVMEYSLALFAVLNEVGKTPLCQAALPQVPGSPLCWCWAGAAH